MKDFTKSLINYTVVVAIPVVFGGIIGIVGYELGREDGKVDGLNQASTFIKTFINNAEAVRTEEE